MVYIALLSVSKNIALLSLPHIKLDHIKYETIIQKTKILLYILQFLHFTNKICFQNHSKKKKKTLKTKFYNLL